MKTIRRNAKAVADIRARATQCTVFSLTNDFVGKPCDADYAWKQLMSTHDGRLTEHDDKWTIHIHSNLWYELRIPVAPQPDTARHRLTITAAALSVALADLELVGAQWSYQERAAYLIDRLTR